MFCLHLKACLMHIIKLSSTVRTQVLFLYVVLDVPRTKMKPQKEPFEGGN